MLGLGLIHCLSNENIEEALFRINYIQSRLEIAAQNYKKHGFLFFETITTSLKNQISNENFGTKLRSYTVNDTIENNNGLETVLTLVKHYEIFHKTYLNPVSLSDAFKIAVLTDLSEKKDNPEKYKKMRDSIIEIIKKEEQKESQEKIDKVYSDVYSQISHFFVMSLNFLSEGIEELMNSLRKFNDKVIEKKINHAKEYTLSFIDEISLLLPLNHVDKLDKLDKILLEYNQTESVYDAFDAEELRCSYVFCRKHKTPSL